MANDTILDRAQRVEHSLGGSAFAQAAVGGPCPRCGARVEAVLHGRPEQVSCQECGMTASVAP